MKTQIRGRTVAILLLSSLFLIMHPPAVEAEPGGETNLTMSTSNSGFVHAVYFWLRTDLTPDERQAFVDGLHALRGIETVEHGWIGVPADTDRPIIDSSYSYALTLVFADEAGHDAYQVDPVHDRFREESANMWERVLIYDSVESGDSGP